MGQTDEELLEALRRVPQAGDGPHRSAVLSDVELAATRFAAQRRSAPAEEPIGPARRIRAACYGLIVESDRLLLCRLSSLVAHAGRWTLPGGGMEAGEAPRETAAREIAEETGLTPQVGGLVAVDHLHIPPSASSSGDDLHAIRLMYEASVPPGLEPRAEKDGSTDLAAWVPRSAIRELPRVDLVEAGLRSLGWDVTYQLRDAGDHDIEYVHAVRTEALRDHVTATFGSWDDEEQRERLQAGWTRYRYRIVQVGDEDVGVLCVDPDADPLRLLVIALEPSIRGRGIGTAIVHDVVEQAAGTGKAVQLRVMRSNPAARRLYERLGFTVTDETATHHLMSTA